MTESTSLGSNCFQSKGFSDGVLYKYACHISHEVTEVQPMLDNCRFSSCRDVAMHFES